VIQASILADSISPSTNSPRVTTWLLTYPRFIHAQVMTYRCWSRNAQSSRAIPVRKRIKAVWSNPVVPIRWGANQKGMQAYAQLSWWRALLCETLWRTAARMACATCLLLSWLGLHKQWANRLLEPFDTITMVVTGTDWENFFAQRTAHDAQDEIGVLAWLMADIYYNSQPKLLKAGDYHRPFILPSDFDLTDIELNRVSAARAARGSYLSFHGARNVEDDLALFNRLVTDSHLTPLEHVCRPAGEDETTRNLRGWVTLRQGLPQEALKFDYAAAKAARVVAERPA
jgi:hypothetical protein